MSTQHSRFSQRHLVGLVLVVVIVAGSVAIFYRSSTAPAPKVAPTAAVASVPAPSPIAASASENICDRPNLTEAEVATYRGISPEALEEFKQEKKLTNAAICKMPDAFLREEIANAGKPEADGPAEAQALRLLQQQDEHGFIPDDGFQKAAEHMQQMRALQTNQPPPQAGINSNQWSWIGPGNIGGRIRTIVIHPTNPQNMWIGSIAGGIWSTSDGGASWQPVNDFMANLAVSTMVIDPSNPSTMYAGTGEGFGNTDAIRGAGVFKSTDGGVTWNQLANTANANWYYVNRLAISPDGTTLLAATRTGVWRSTNGGTNWTLTNDTANSADIDFNPSNSSLAVVGAIVGNSRYSTDGGASWTAATGLPANVRVEVAYAASSPSIVYASVNQNSGQIWRSIDGGQSYTLQNTGSGYLDRQGWYGNALWVDPTNPATLIVGGIDLWKSTNSGTSLATISTWYNSPSSAHADQHVIVSHPQFNGNTNTTVFFGNDGGIYKAATVYTVGNNPPDNTNGWQELNNNLGITQFYGAAGNSTGKIVGGTQDNGSLSYTGNSETWKTVFGGDGGFAAADPNDPNYVYGEYTNANIHRSTSGGTSNSGEYISGNYWNGSAYVWKAAPYKIADSESGCALFIAPFVLDPNNANRMLVGGCSLWRTNDVKTANTNSTGPTWAVIKSASGGTISAIAVAPGNSNIIWVGYDNGDVYLTINGTNPSPTWSKVDTNGVGLPDRYVTRLTIDRVDPTIVYATFGGFSPDNVWRTNNSGTSWSNISGSGLTALPSVPVRSLVTYANNASWLYVGTEVGVFTSEDGGASWKLPQDGPANVSVDELFWMNDTLVAATHGRGLFQVNLGVALQKTAVNWHELSGNANGAIDPGETIGITVDLRNQGSQAATGISSILALTGGSATVQNGASAYPNIPTNTTQTNTTEYTVLVSPGQTCGSDLSFTHTTSYNGNQTLMSNLTLPTGTSGPAVNYAYTGIIIPIPDNNSVDIPLTIAATGQVNIVKVRLNLTHTWDADLNISLVSPSGTVVALATARGSSGDNYTNTIFDDAAATAIAAGSAPFTGSFRPEQALAAFLGQPINGIWNLRVADTAANDTGTVLGWSLDLQPPTVCSAAVTLNPVSMSFGSQATSSTSAIQTATLQNNTSTAINISALSFTGDFGRSGGTCPSGAGSLAAGASCTIGIVFTPTAVGARSGGLSVTSDAAGSPHTISLSGTGASVAVTSFNTFLPLVVR